MLSAFMITRDAERWLAPVLANLRQVADEIIVIVDEASSDDTWQVARRLADRAEFWPVPDAVPEAVRKEAAALCNGDWIWMADDDELIPPALVRYISLLSGGYQEYAFARKHVIGDGSRWITSAPWWPDTQIRLRSREAWQRYGWPRVLHQTPPDFRRMLVQDPAFWHLKFMLRSLDERQARLAAWGEVCKPALNDHYRRFSLPEEYAWETAPIDEEPPAELGEILRSLPVAQNDNRG